MYAKTTQNSLHIQISSIACQDINTNRNARSWRKSQRTFLLCFIVNQGAATAFATRHKNLSLFSLSIAFFHTKFRWTWTNFCSKSQINIRNWPILVKPIKMGTPYCSPGIGDWGKPRGPHSRGWGMQTLGEKQSQVRKYFHTQNFAGKIVAAKRCWPQSPLSFPQSGFADSR